MKRILFALILSVNVLFTFSQECNIALQPIVVPSSDGSYYPQVKSYLTNRLQNITLEAGETSSLSSEQFGIALSYNTLDKQVIGGVPAKIVYNINASLFIVDLKGKTVYSSCSLELKGIGNNETKALMNCFRGLDVGNESVKRMIQDGKKQIINYYDNNFTRIIAKAKTDASMKNYDAAIYSLLSIPECSKGYGAALEMLPIVYRQFVNQHCNENLVQARAAWYASPNSDGASVAGVYLSEIYPDASCYQDAMQLFKEIRKQMGEEWKFMMKQYNDAIALERQQMNMMREIALAYAKNQPKETINIFWK